MNGYTRYPKKMKLTMMNLIFKKGYTKKEVADKYGVRCDTLKDWIKRYKRYGDSAFDMSHVSRRTFSYDLKIKVINEIQQGLKSIKSVAIELNCDKKIVKSWFSMYNFIKENSSEGDIDNMKYMKIDNNRKLEIVKFCIKNNYNYSLAAKEYGVSYANVYNWCRLFSKNGDIAFKKKKKLPKKEKTISEDTQKIIADYVKKKLKEWEQLSFGEIEEIGKS